VVTQQQRIQKQLPSKFGDCDLKVEQTATLITIRVCGSITFASGSDKVLDQFKPIAARIAAAINGEPGKITVVGHTDTDPIGKLDRFKSNYDLSVARAEAVAKLIKASLDDPNRVESKGRGPDQPIADNKTSEGKAKNRRVEVQVARTSE
jgi:type VI secretion system protein ImpK